MSPNITEQFFPFHTFGLHRNPFGSLSEDEWYAVTVPPPAVHTAIVDGFDHLLVLGRKGRGKSTTLNYLRYHFMLQGQRVGYERIPRWQWHYTTATSALDVFALDEAQRLAPWQMWRLFAQRDRHKTRLIVGSHYDHTLEFRLRGLNVRTVRLRHQMTPAQLALILQRRLEALALDDATPTVWFTEDAVAALWHRYDTDLRSMTFFLYDGFQQLERPGGITPADLNHWAQRTRP